ncbi:EAL domain-containing protein [Jeotgalibacillus haloalkalitolerans]|uniref:EAL domain-containing protein n=1 Tax=Jeotgalibacillus haloalkalitolerans TaxID=3104292 RepID=A0ABU5KI27_9BACL|nr:EAL domain-containing protein [Jeotgalibacillus sp. HH7-29]MDZ5710830.1 EAL domain-containing protein [Jeotgalibacillus sp. HH7-29]
MEHLKADPQYLFNFFAGLYKMVFLMEVDTQGYKYKDVTPEAVRLASLPEDWKNRYIHDIYDEKVAAPLISQYDEVASTGEPVFYSDQMNKLSNISEYAASALMPITDRYGHVRYIIGLTDDLSDSTSAKLLASIENIDYLTGLPSMLKVKAELSRMENTKLSILYLNIDRFKLINEWLGIEETNELLKKIAKQTGVLLPPGSILGRIDGDEFIIAVRELIEDEVYDLAETILSSLSAFTYEVKSVSIPVTGCIGICMSPGHSNSLITNACAAMVEAKREGRNSIRLFKTENHLQANKDEAIMEAELYKALEQDELTVYYQPKLDAHTNQVHYEALVRWFSPVLGTVPPLKFIPVAEKTTLIQDVTRTVVYKVCADIKQTPELFKNARTSINLSAALFEPELIENHFITIINECGVDPASLEIEITENMLMADPIKGMEIIEHLKKIGFRVVIDDFGVSYSSLNYLRSFSLDGIKIDRSFISQIDQHHSEKDISIVHFIIQLAKKLNLYVTAEGVETKEQFDILTSLGCDEIQGYYFSRPLPLEKIKSTIEHFFDYILQKNHGYLEAAVTKDTVDEASRLKEIERLQILDTPAEERFDRITRIIQNAFHVPICFISIIDDKRQWFKSCIGLPEPVQTIREVPRDQTLCDYVIRQQEALIIENMAEHPDEEIREFFKMSGLQFYAGIPLISMGEMIGTLCITDYLPRTFNKQQFETLIDYSKWVESELELYSLRV